MQAIFWLIDTILQLYVYAIFAMVILSWLFVFNVLNPRNQFVSAVSHFLDNITEPVLRPIRNVMPNLGGIDLSPAAAGIRLDRQEFYSHVVGGGLRHPRYLRRKVYRFA